MTPDEQAIRGVVQRWMDASQSGDQETVLALMTDDVVFMTNGREPFGKDEFASVATGPKPTLVEGTADVREVQVEGNFAWARTHLDLTLKMPDDTTLKKSGYAMTIFEKQPDGRWLLKRDANLL